MVLKALYEWKEDVDALYLTMDVKGRTSQEVDIFVSDVVVKIHFKPYLLLLDLYASIHPETASVQYINGKLHLTVQKTEARLWNGIEMTEISKQDKLQRRQDSMEKQFQFEQQLKVTRQDKKYENEKKVLRDQMAIDENARQYLEDLKVQEKKKEEDEMFATFAKIQFDAMKSKQMTSTTSSNTMQPTNTPTTTSSNSTTATTSNRPSAILKDDNTHTNNTHTNTSTKSTPNSTKNTSIWEMDEVLEVQEDGGFDISRITTTTTIPIATNNDTNTTTTNSNSGTTSSYSDSHTTNSGKNTMKMTSDTTNCTKITDSSSSSTSCTNTTDDENTRTTSTNTSRHNNDTSNNSNVEEVLESVIPPRESSQSKITFTPRVFPTPQRESKAVEEEEWMIKNKQHLKRHKTLSTAYAYDISESDPMWLKAKGDDFYRNKDFKSAINAYTEALSHHPDLISCYSNRAACYLQLLQYTKCIDDCTLALSKLPDTGGQQPSTTTTTTGTESMYKSMQIKLKLLIRRGTAYCQVGQYKYAKADYGIALTMDAKNIQLQQDLVHIGRMETCMNFKQQGDVEYQKQEYADAIAYYTKALQLDPQSITCLSNRGACYLALYDYQNCIQDCSLALQYLQTSSNNDPTSTATDNRSTTTSHITKPTIQHFQTVSISYQQRQRAVLKTLLRRGTAYISMKQYKNAIQDYAYAMELDPTNETLQYDYEQLQQYIV